MRNSCTHAPCGDGNRSRASSMASTSVATHTPSRGRIQLDFAGFITDFESCNSHPSRGRIRFVEIENHTSFDLQLTPLTGTETCPCLGHNMSHPRCNSHPSRGRIPVDNAVNCAAERCNSHPSRGRKLTEPEQVQYSIILQLTPLTGTETRRTSCLPPRHPRTCNSHPSRGRKRVNVFICCRQFALATHTPHGDGNFSISEFVHVSVVATHTPHGDGNVFNIPITTISPTCNSHPSRGRRTKNEPAYTDSFFAPFFDLSFLLPVL